MAALRRPTSTPSLPAKTCRGLVHELFFHFPTRQHLVAPHSGLVCRHRHSPRDEDEEMGGSQSREQLEQCKADLAKTKNQLNQMSDERDELRARVDSQAMQLEQSRTSLQDAAREAKQQLEEKEEAVNKAVKQQQLAESLRRSDALLAKRLMNAQLRHLGGQPLPGLDGSTAPPAEEGALAASLALAAQDELQLRQMLLHSANELEASQQRVADLQRASLSNRRSELSRELWLPDLCDVSMTLRSSQYLVLGGVRLPRAQRPGVRGSGISPAVAILRHLGQPTPQVRRIPPSYDFPRRTRRLPALPPPRHRSALTRACCV
jgi:hypothetical protein